MSKINEGNIIEGIFSIGIAILLRDGSITKQELNQIRTKIEPALFKNGPSNILIGEKTVTKGKNLPDRFVVHLEIRMKPEGGIDQAFGKKFKTLYDKSKDVGEIDGKINQVIQNTKSDYQNKLLTVRDNFLKNNVGEVVRFTVLCDGIAGESSGGEIKGDVFVKIVASTGKGDKVIFQEDLSFSLKSNSNTVANLSPYESSMYVLNLFGVKVTKKQQEIFKEVDKTARTAHEKKEKLKAVRNLFIFVADAIEKKVKGDAQSSKKAFDFLAMHTFGKDNAHLVELLKDKTKELTREYFDAVFSDMRLYAKKKISGSSTGFTAGYIVFYNKKTDGPIFHMRMRIRLGGNVYKDLKFLLELGGETGKLMNR